MGDSLSVPPVLDVRSVDLEVRCSLAPLRNCNNLSLVSGKSKKPTSEGLGEKKYKTTRKQRRHFIFENDNVFF